jgi:hypothetical protein
VTPARRSAAPGSLLAELERIGMTFDTVAAARKRELLAQLSRARFATPAALARYHECLCRLRTYPDNAAILDEARRQLHAFDGRRDLRRHRKALEGTGIAGTDIVFPFFWFTALWILESWADRLRVEWSEPVDLARLERLLPLLLSPTDALTVDQLSYTPREWVRELKGPDETDAAFLLRRFRKLPFGDAGREIAYDDMTFWLRLAGGPDTPSRSRAEDTWAPIAFQSTPLETSRPDLLREARRPPKSIVSVPRAEGRRLIDLARTSMVTRARDLDAFENADPDDVLRIDCGGGLQFVAIGQRPERRLLLESVYGLLTIRNGVPIGYVLMSSLFGSTEIAYNVFETFRGGDSARIFGRVIATARALFGSNAFSIEPFQLGYGNDEGLRSGAWWFYYKLGFRPVDAKVLDIVARESKRLAADPRHRTDRATLKALASAHMYFHVGAPRSDTLGRIPLDVIGLRLTRRLSEFGGSDREGTLRRLARDAAARLGFGGFGRLSPPERESWTRLAVLIDLIPGVERWSAAEKRAAAAVLRAKGGRHECEFVRLFDAHPKLRRGVLDLAKPPAPARRS